METSTQRKSMETLETLERLMDDLLASIGIKETASQKRDIPITRKKGKEILKTSLTHDVSQAEIKFSKRVTWSDNLVDICTLSPRLPRGTCKNYNTRSRPETNKTRHNSPFRLSTTQLLCSPNLKAVLDGAARYDSKASDHT